MNGCQKCETKNCSKDAKGRSQNRCIATIPKDRLRIVHFPHPGQDYPVCRTNAKLSNGVYAVNWSESGIHCRRLIKHSGAYVDIDWAFHEDEELVFWNEWEGPTFANDIKGRKNKASASFIHVVRYPEVPCVFTSSGGCNFAGGFFGRYGDLMNTDPCVFGKTFKYSVCRQTPKGIMRQLAPGSLIVFGSRIGGEFYLDTMFVVGDVAFDYRDGSDLGLLCSKAYRNLTIDRLPTGDYTFYRGVAPNNRQSLKRQCFSFVPARLSSVVGYTDRCKLDLVQLNRVAHAKAFDVDVWRNKKTTAVSTPQIVNVWAEIVQQVRRQEFVLGVRFDWPKKGAN